VTGSIQENCVRSCMQETVCPNIDRPLLLLD